MSYLQSKFLHPLNDLVQKFDMLQKLVEHVVDMDRLPDLVVAARHDPLLQELDSDMRSLEREARELRDIAGNSWASFTEVKLESSAQLGFYLRTTRGDDERQLRQSGGKVEILSLQKVTGQIFVMSLHYYDVCMSFCRMVEWSTFHYSSSLEHFVRVPESRCAVSQAAGRSCKECY